MILYYFLKISHINWYLYYIFIRVLYETSLYFYLYLMLYFLLFIYNFKDFFFKKLNYLNFLFNYSYFEYFPLMLYKFLQFISLKNHSPQLHYLQHNNLYKQFFTYLYLIYNKFLKISIY